MKRVIIYGYGNIGRAVLDAVEAAPDMEAVGVVSSSLVVGALGQLPIVRHIEDLPPADAIILCAPSEAVPDLAEKLLRQGHNTVDSFDMHDRIPQVRQRLDAAARQGGATAVMAAGWDPGSDSMVRALFQALAPLGHTDTDFGPGMSMGHSTAVKNMDGVRDALSVTIPLGNGIHRRMLYMEVEEGVNLPRLENAIHEHPYFLHDETHIRVVEDVDELKDVGHGVNLVRRGVSGRTHNQFMKLEMRINNPALTGQILVAAARAGWKRPPGCYTMIELPPVDLLPGDADQWIGKLV